MKLSGVLPVYNKAGDLDPTTESLQAWWNLSPNRWITPLETPPTPETAGPGAVEKLVVADLPDAAPCTYRLSFTVPRSAPGLYPVELFYIGGGCDHNGNAIARTRPKSGSEGCAEVAR